MENIKRKIKLVRIISRLQNLAIEKCLDMENCQDIADVYEKFFNKYTKTVDVETLRDIRRMCEIVLNNTFGNRELDSLALYVGHHPLILNSDNAQQVAQPNLQTN